MGGGGAGAAARLGRARRRSSPTGTSAEAPGEWFRNPDYAADAAHDRRRRAARVLRRRVRRAIVDARAGARRLSHDGRPAEEPADVGDADLDRRSRATACGSCRRTTRASRRSRCCGCSSRTISRRSDTTRRAYLHLLIEAKKLAYADLARYVGDAGPPDGAAELLLSDKFIAERRSHIDPDACGDARRSGAGAHVERDDLSHRGRQRRQHGVVHQQSVRRVRIWRRGAGDGLRAA